MSHRTTIPSPARALLRVAAIAAALALGMPVTAAEVGGELMQKIPEEARLLLQDDEQAWASAQRTVSTYEAMLLDTQRIGEDLAAKAKERCRDATDQDGETRKYCRDLRREDRANVARHLTIVSKIYGELAAFHERSSKRKADIALITRDANRASAKAGEGRFTSALSDVQAARARAITIDNTDLMSMEADADAYIDAVGADLESDIDAVLGSVTAQDTRARARNFGPMMALSAGLSHDLSNLYATASTQYLSLANAIETDGFLLPGDADDGAYRPPVLMPTTVGPDRSRGRKSRRTPPPKPRDDADLDREVR